MVMFENLPSKNLIFYFVAVEATFLLILHLSHFNVAPKVTEKTFHKSLLLTYSIPMSILSIYMISFHNLL